MARTKSTSLLIIFLGLLLTMTACGGGGADNASQTPTVTITPASPAVNGGGTQQFTATVTNSTSTSVLWSVSCTAGGAACGSISTSGLYTAPATVASSATVTVTATLASDATKTGSTTIRLTPVSVAVAPATSTATATGTQQFTATVSGSSNTGVSWSADCTAGGAACGSISAAGLYTAPSVVPATTAVTVTATSSADNTKKGTATITLNPLTVSVAPATISLTATQTQQFTQTITGNPDMSVTWSVSCIAGGAACGSINANGLYTAPSVVPATASVTVTAISSVDNTKSATATVTLNPLTMTVAPGTGTLTASQTQQFTQTVTGNPDTSVTWSATCEAGPPSCGSITTTGLYSAPVVVVTTTTVTVTATSSVDNTKTATATVTLNPLTISVSPGTASLTASQTQQFSKTVTGNPDTDVTWSVDCTAGGAACGTIDGNGLYTAPSAVLATIPVTVTATSSADSTKTATATVTLNTLIVEVAPGTASLTAAQTQQFTQTITGNPNTAVTWSVSCAAGGAACGTVDSTGLYSAPAVIPSQYDVTVMATSGADNTKSATAVVTLHPLTIQVSPQSATLGVSMTQQFDADIQGNPNTAVTWSVNCQAGGAACGSIDANGLYTAPATLDTESSVTVTATSSADNSKTATATVTLVPVTVSVSPKTASLTESGTQQFTANVQGTTNTAVTWSVSCEAGGAACGGIDGNGLYTAPATIGGPTTVTVTATSQADTAKTDTATVTVTSVPVLVVGITPSTVQTVTLGGSVFLSATVSNDSGNQGVSWSITPVSGCGALSNQTNTSATFAAPSSLAANCTANVTAKSVADNTKQASVSINVLQSASLTINTMPQEMNNGAVNLPYGMGFNVTGGTWPYHYSVSSGSLPPGVDFSATNIGQLLGTPTTQGTYNFTVQVTDSAASPASISQSYAIVISPVPTGAHNNYISGQYACLLNGFIDADQSRWAMLTGVTADGSGHITSGVFDYNSKAMGMISGSLTGSYSLDATNHGTMSVITTGGTFLYSVSANSVGTAPATIATLTEFDDAGNSPSGQHGGGVCYRQDSSKFTSANLSGGYAFGMTGESGGGTPRATIGRLSMSGGSISSGNVDQINGNTFTSAITFTGTYGVPDSNGRFTMALNTPGGTMTFISYVIDANRALLLSSIPHNTDELQSGQVRKQQQASYTATNMNGPFVLYEDAFSISSSNTVQGYRSMVLQGSCNTTGSCSAAISDTNDNGTYVHNDAVGAATATVETSGRVTLTPTSGSGLYIYLYDQASGFVLDPGDSTYPNVGFGWVERQTLSTFTNSAVAGNYILDPLPRMQADGGVDAGYVNVNATGTVSGANDSAGHFWSDYNSPISADWAFTDTVHGQATVSEGGYAALYCYAITSLKMVCMEGSSNNPQIQLLEK